MPGPLQIGDWIFSVKQRWTAISPDRRSVYSFDLEGRPVSWFEGGRAFKRSLGSEIHVRERVSGKRHRSIASPDEARKLFAGILDRLAGAPLRELRGESKERLDAILRWTPEELLEQKERFDAAYRPISILPPDQYLSVVLQATFGCSWNRCTFCSFYQDRPFATRSEDEFRAHLLAVRSLLGRGAKLRRRIFFADGNALMLSTGRLRPLFRLARESFPDRTVSGFVDVIAGERKPIEHWTGLAEQGLERVYVGLETGHDPLLRWMNKPQTAAEARDFVVTLKRAGLLVSTILMCGAGGDRFAEEHVRDTLELVSGLPLDRGDIVYLSPFVEQPRSVYAARSNTEGVLPLDDREQAAQYARLRNGIRRALPGVKVARYDIREFLY